MKIPFLPRFAALAGLAALAACDVVEPGDYSRELAYLEYEGRPVQIEVPATARVEQAVTVRITTYGSGCAEAAETQVAVSGLIAVIRPYDRTRQGGSCPAIIQEFVHEAQVTFETPGTATIRVHGRSGSGGAAMVEERTLTVQPAT